LNRFPDSDKILEQKTGQKYMIDDQYKEE